MYRSTASKLRPVNPACTINFPPAINCADGTCFSTIEPLPFSDTEHYGCITFQGHARLLHVAEAQPDGKLTQTLSDAGVIRNATKCSITTNEFQTLPEIRGEIQSTVVNTHFYVPDQIQIVADHEIPLIKQISPEEEVTLLDEVKSKLMVPSQSYDVNSLFHIEQASARQSHKTYWYLIATMSVCAVRVIYLSLRSPLRNLATRCLLPNTVHEPITTAQNPSPLPPRPRRRESSPTNDNSQKDEAFMSYSMQPAN